MTARPNAMTGYRIPQMVAEIERRAAMWKRLHSMPTKEPVPIGTPTPHVPERVVLAVCQSLGVSFAETFRKLPPSFRTYCRMAPHPRNRWRVWTALKDLGYSAPKIALATHAPNHSSVLTGIYNLRAENAVDRVSLPVHNSAITV